MDLDHGVMAPMRLRHRRLNPGDAAQPVTPPSGRAARNSARQKRKCALSGDTSPNVTAHSKEIAGGRSRFFCKSFLDKSSRPIFYRAERWLVQISALCAKSSVTGWSLAPK
jgi:hypothetical protein